MDLLAFNFTLSWSRKEGTLVVALTILLPTSKLAVNARGPLSVGLKRRFGLIDAKLALRRSIETFSVPVARMRLSHQQSAAL
jgi:hypothetical protein